ncbi:MAG: ThaI family type II restriction endonuclease [Candidatus Diapherotrites archaeon]|nr:ThaI family type II restriction endonuclease [Candidatus Diapherotrites archaeon]
MLVAKIKERLPKLFRIAEIENSRAGKIGMEVGFTREKIIAALLIHKFGAKKVDTNIPATEKEIDVILDGKGLSIKTITEKGGIKAVWTVDAQSSKDFLKEYKPKCDIILVQTWWGKDKDSFFYMPLSVQMEVIKKVGTKGYLNLPKEGTNPRGIEFSKLAMEMMLNHKDTLKIRINWIKEEQPYDVYKRWVKYWE